MKSNWCIRVLLMTVLAAALPLLAQDNKDDDEGLLKVERPDKCPKIADDKLELARKDKTLKELVASHDQIMGIYKELEASKAMAEGGDKKSEKNVDKLEKRLIREKKLHEKIAEKLKKPWVKDYNKLRKKYNDLTKKGDAATAQNNDKRAEKLYQEAQTFTGTMEGLKTRIDYVDYFCFFQGYDDGKEAEANDKPLIQGDKEDDNKKKDAKKATKKKKKAKDDALD